MKSLLIIGAGRFGALLCRNLSGLGNEVMVVDDDERKLADLLDCVVEAKIGDCTRTDVLRSLGPEHFDACIVCVTDAFQSSLEITSQLHEMGAKKVISLASTGIQAKFLRTNGADEVIYPERDMANRLAMSISYNTVFDFIQLSDEYSIFEIVPLRSWLGRSIRAVNVRARYGISILGVKKDGKVTMPGPDYVFSESEHLIVMGRTDTSHELVGKNE